MVVTNNNIDLERNLELPKFRSYLSPESRVIISRSDSIFYQYEVRRINKDSLVQKFQGPHDLRHYILRNKDELGYTCQDHSLESEIQTIITDSLKIKSSSKYTGKPTKKIPPRREPSSIKNQLNWRRNPLSA